MRRLARWIGAPLAVAAALASVGCDADGPGTWNATVEGPQPVGAVVLEVRGPGLVGFAGAGDARVFADASPAVAGVWRLVVVSATGDASFRINVESREAAPPVVTVVSATDVANQTLTGLGAYEVRVAR